MHRRNTYFQVPSVSLCALSGFSRRVLPRLGLLLTGFFIVLGAADRSLAQEASKAEETSTTERPTESWYGTLDGGQRHFRFFITLDESEGSWSGELLSLDEGGRTFVLDDVKRLEDSFEFKLNISGATFSGKLSGESIDGMWLQRGGKLPLKLERVEKLPEEEYEAVWKGTINIIIQKVDVQVRELKSGEVYFDVLSQNVGGFVASKSVDGETITIDIPMIKGKFTGKLTEDGEELDGNWKQNIISTSLKLKKFESPTQSEQLKPNRPQTPKAPFPYSSSEVTFANTAADVELAGTLTVPNGEGPFPAVVLVSGSGPQDRDETIAGHKPFWVIADHFSRNGIAVLRYDDRGTAKSTGDFNAANSLDLASDAEAAVAFVQKQPKINASQVGLCGHSEGGLIAPMIAAKPDSSVAFIVLMAGPGVNGERVLISQMPLILKVAGADQEMIQTESAVQKILLSLAKKTPKLTEEQYIKEAIEATKEFTEGESDASLQAKFSAAAKQLQSPWFQFFIKHEPRPSLEKVRCPVLALNGDKDLQVESKLNLPEIRAALEVAPTQEFEIVELSGLNHLFQKCRTGSIQEYGQIEQTFSEEALAKMTEWIFKQTKS